MKNKIKYLLHSVFGFRNYLFLFSLFKIWTLKHDKKEKDFFAFLDLIPSGTTVLDIGANIGIMSVHLARKAGDGQVHAFEPMRNNYETLERVLRYFKLGNVVVHKIALGNTEGSIQMVMPVVGKVRLQGLSHVVHESITDYNEGELVEVPLRMLDRLPELESAGKRISGIKIDIENFEFFALDGGKELMRKHRPVVYAELWDNENRTNCFTLMRQLNYTIHVSGETGLVLFDPKIHKKQNFLFLPA